MGPKRIFWLSRPPYGVTPDLDDSVNDRFGVKESQAELAGESDGG